MTTSLRLDSARVAAFADLIAEITGAPPAPRPALAPILLFAEPEVRRALDLPRVGEEEVLLHEAQSLTDSAALPLDTLVTAQIARRVRGAAVETSVTFEGGCRLSFVLRRASRAEARASKAATFRAFADLGDAGLTRPLSITQAQVDRYLTLSGDDNPIHSDAGAAASLALPAPVVPGLLLAACIPHPAARVMKARFMAALCVGQPFQIALQTRAADRFRAYIARPDTEALAVADLA